MLVPSMRNSVSMNVSLMQTTGCKRVIYSENVDAKIQELKEEATGVERVPFLGLEELLRSPKAKHYPYEQNFREVENDPALVCHTSGSTGNPKPITMTHGSMAVWDGHRNIPKIPGRRNQDYALFDFGEGGGRFYSSYPPFHVSIITHFELHKTLTDIACRICNNVLSPNNVPGNNNDVAA